MNRKLFVCATVLVASCLFIAAPSVRADDETTAIFRLKHLKPSRAESIYRQFVVPGPHAKIAVDRGDKVLVIRDEKERLKRFRQTLERMDQRGTAGLGIFMRPVHYADPEVLARQLEEILLDRFRHPLCIVSHTAGSRILVMTTRPQYEVVHRLASRLDRSDRSRK